MSKTATAKRSAQSLHGINLHDALSDKALLGQWFTGESWAAWRVFWKALDGLPLNENERAVYLEFTGREYDNDLAAAVYYAVLVCGRRAGKSRVLAAIGIYLSIFHDWRPYLTPGEVGTVLVLAASKDQAKVIFRYVAGMIRQTPMLAKYLKRETADTVELTNGIAIRVTAASFRTTRGVTTVAILADETAFWWTDTESAEQDVEILRALKPATMTVPGSRILIASSPYARRGLLWNEFKRLYAQDVPRELCWKAGTRAMNPTIPKDEIDREFEKDPEYAKAEFGAEFRSDLESYISPEAVDEVVLKGIREIAPIAGVRYLAFVDPSGGSGGDSMTLGIAHFDGKEGASILDCLLEIKPPFSPENVVTEFAARCKSYKVNEVYGDKWGGQFVAEAFQREGLRLKACEQTKSQLYSELLPLINSGKCRLLDNPRLVNQLVNLERRTGRGTGRDSIDHPPGQHDDAANAAAGALVMVKARMPMVISEDFVRKTLIPRMSRAQF